VPKGPVVGSRASAAVVRREVGPLGERLVAAGAVDGLDYEQTVTLWQGIDRVDCRTRVIDHASADRLLRLRFPLDLPGTLPVSEVADAVIGRGFALPDVDVAEAPWTLDNPANTWFGLSATARVTLTDQGGSALGERALGVAEVIVPELADAADARDLIVALAAAGVTATTASADWSRYGWLDVDSNLPDFRIVLGGLETNSAARELLERAGADYAAVLAAHGRVWVPAEKPLTEVWQPGADLRDLRALPVLLVTDPAALAADLADARIEAVCPGELPATERLTDHTAALLTYGLPGFAVDPTGALHLSLLRSCTGWPSGVWIDPPRRTVPDGSSFQLQHWTHDFSYSLVSGEGDWRALTLPAQGQEFNHELLARVVPTQDGTLPATQSWLRVEPAREVRLSTLKPTGDPIAAGSAAVLDPAAGVTLRLVESTGLGRTARLSGALVLDGLHRADLLERPQAPVEGELELTGAQVATLTALPRASGAGRGNSEPLGPIGEIAQPVHSRYWLHNRGPAPMGYLPVSVGVSPGLLTCGSGAGEALELSVVLASHLRDAAVEGTAEVIAPDGWQVDLRRRPYRLDAAGHLRFPVTVTPPADAQPGLYFVAVRTEYAGQQIEDVATVAVGELPDLLPAAGEPLDDWGKAQGTKSEIGRDTGLLVESAAASLRVAPGGRAWLEVVLTNRTRGEIRGELQTVSPWGTWAAIGAPVAGFTLAPGERQTFGFEVAPPLDTDPGSYWAVTKVMWFGRCQYAPTVSLVVAP
jgi:hypothetical protein